MNIDSLKQAAAQAAVKYLRPRLEEHTIIGVGTGSTANHFIDGLAAIKSSFEGTVASSEASAERLRSHGIPVYDLNGVNRVDFYVDGADEIDHSLHMVKGGGGALTREKIVAACAQTFICIADETKLVDLLGVFPVPVEVIPMARSLVGRALVTLGGDPAYRTGFVTDNGNIILDVHNLEILSPTQTEEKMNQITGMVTNGLFARRPADLLLLGTQGGVQTITAKNR